MGVQKGVERTFLSTTSYSLQPKKISHDFIDWAKSYLNGQRVLGWYKSVAERFRKEFKGQWLEMGSIGLDWF